MTDDLAEFHGPPPVSLGQVSDVCKSRGRGHRLITLSSRASFCRPASPRGARGLDTIA